MPEVDENFPRMWVEFPDPAEFDPETEDQPDTMFRCDLTWLTSDYKCIFGEGCCGIYEDKPDNGCCTLGAHFTEAKEIKKVKRYVNMLTPDTWQRYDKRWTEQEDGATKTRVVDGGCIFLNDPGFAAGGGCALHHLAFRKGISHVETKPDVCWQLPIRRTYRTVERADDTEYLEVTIGEYTRDGWGPGGHDLDWYCTANTEAHVGQNPLYLSSEAELRELMGDQGYEVLKDMCDDLMAQPKLNFIHLATKEARLERQAR